MAIDFIVELYQKILEKKGTVNLEVFRRYLQMKHRIKFTSTSLSNHLKN